MGNIFGWGGECQEKGIFLVPPWNPPPSRVLMRCTASFPFFLLVGDRVPHLPADCDSQIIILKKVRCQRAATRTYLHCLQFIFHTSEWVNSYFTLLNEPPLPNAEYKVVDKNTPFLILLGDHLGQRSYKVDIILAEEGTWKNCLIAYFDNQFIILTNSIYS